MSWLKEVPKTMEYIVEHPYETLLFVTPSTKYTKSKIVTTIASTCVETMKFGEIKDCLNDPDYILIKIDKEEKNNGK